MPRLATSQDLQAVLALAGGKVYPDFPWEEPSVSGLGLLQSLSDDHQWQEKFDLLVWEESSVVSGFLLLEKQRVNGSTGDQDSLLRDLFATTPDGEVALLAKASTLARGYGSHFLTTEIAASDEVRKEMLKSLDFALESLLVATPSGTPELPEESPYSVRRTTADDGFAVSVLSSEVMTSTLSGAREYDLGELAVRNMGVTMARVARQDSGSVGLLLTKGEEMAGYLLLEVTKRYGYVADVAIEPAHRGGTAVRHLVLSGSRLLHEMGVPWYIGDISAANTRALGSALRGCGFEAAGERYGLKL